MGDRFEDRAAAAYTRIAKDYPLSDHADDAAQELKDMNRPVPDADPVAYARMKYELENRQKQGMVGRVKGVFTHSPDTHAAAKSGTPAMAATRPTIPLSVPAGLSPAGTAPGAGGSDVSVQTVSDSSVLDSRPDARQNPPAAGGTPAVDGSPAANGAASREGAASGNTPVAQPASTVAVQPLPTNHQPIKRKKSKKQQKAEAQQQQQSPAQVAPQPTAPPQQAAQPQQPEPQPK